MNTESWRATRRRQEELHCPHCGYDLRGQTIDRCPECGNEYDPDEIRQELRWQWESALAPLHTALPLLAGAGLVLVLMTLVPDRIWWRAGLLITLFTWLGGKVLIHILRGWIMGDVLGEFRTGAGPSMLYWCIDVAGTFPWWTDALFIAAMITRYIERELSQVLTYSMIAIGAGLAVWGWARQRSLSRRGQLEHLGDVERRLLWRGQWVALVLLLVVVPLAVMTAR